MLGAVVLIAATLAGPPRIVSPGVVQSTVAHAGYDYRVVTIDLRHAQLDLFGQTPGYGDVATLGEISTFLHDEGRDFVLGTNAGIFDKQRRPLGLHIEHGVERRAINRSTGWGNFYMKPNGVFWIDASGAHVADTDSWQPTGARMATQSGPILVMDGELHPAFREHSTNLLLRSGIGVVDQHTVVLAISVGVTRFWDFATLFRDVLGCTDALYLDGVISQLADAEQPPGITDGGYAGLLVVSTPRPATSSDLLVWTPPRYPAVGRQVGPGHPVLASDGEMWEVAANRLCRTLRKYAAAGLEVRCRPGPIGTIAVVVQGSTEHLSAVRAALEAEFGPPLDAPAGPGRVTLTITGDRFEVEWLRSPP
jgi:uncharacterized protein YigE (DUF2233 family)